MRAESMLARALREPFRQDVAESSRQAASIACSYARRRSTTSTAAVQPRSEQASIGECRLELINQNVCKVIECEHIPV
jgi:hypothetical protein